MSEEETKAEQLAEQISIRLVNGQTFDYIKKKYDEGKNIGWAFNSEKWRLSIWATDDFPGNVHLWVDGQALDEGITGRFNKERNGLYMTEDVRKEKVNSQLFLDAIEKLIVKNLGIR